VLSHPVLYFGERGFCLPRHPVPGRRALAVTEELVHDLAAAYVGKVAGQALRHKFKDEGIQLTQHLALYRIFPVFAYGPS
jgi:hypothetical protein